MSFFHDVNGTGDWWYKCDGPGCKAETPHFRHYTPPTDEVRAWRVGVSSSLHFCPKCRAEHDAEMQYREKVMDPTGS